MQTIRRITATAAIVSAAMLGASGAANAGQVSQEAVQAEAGQAEEVVVSWRVSEDRGTGFRVVADIRNQTDQTFTNWSLSAPFRHRVTEISGALSVQDDSSITISSIDTLAPGADRRVEFAATSVGPVSRTPVTCTFQNVPCRVVLPGDSLVEPQHSPEPHEEEPGTQSPPEDAPTAEASEDGSPEPEEPSVPAPAAVPEPGPGDTSPDPAPGAGIQPPSPADPALTLQISVVRDWGSGQSVRVVVRNDGSQTIDGWSVSFPWDLSVDSMWNADSTSGGGFIRATNADWNGQLGPGQAVEFGFTGSPGALPVPEEACTGSTDQGSARCRIAGVVPQP